MHLKFTKPCIYCDKDIVPGLSYRSKFCSQKCFDNMRARNFLEEFRRLEQENEELHNRCEWLEKETVRLEKELDKAKW